ncbi:MAG TPA: diaminopimelate epimerase [Thermoanaerobaculia bacterium]|nr:diaminopimelate epimerase [Thermoanaerobaculia bacterium]
MATTFYKLSGSGNDFLALPEPEAAPTSEEIRAWCRRGISIGADGLIVIRRGPDSPSGTGAPVVEMTYWNADGYPADLCLNGTRCAARLAFELGWAKPTAPNTPLAIRTDAGTWTARLLPGARIALDLPLPQDEVQRFTLEALGTHYEAHWLSIGVPHLVLLWPESLATAPVDTLGPPLRRHAALGPAGANVDFVRFPAEANRHRMEIRTFERGVEGETLSCGTGVLASAAVGLTLGLAAMPLTVSTQGGFELEVSVEPGDTKSWTLSGDARIVASGELWPEAGDSPPAPPWGTSR